MSSRTEYLEDDDLVIAKFLRRSGDFSQTSDSGYLALEHLDTGPKRQKRPAPRCVDRLCSLMLSSAHTWLCSAVPTACQPYDSPFCCAQGLVL